MSELMSGFYVFLLTIGEFVVKLDYVEQFPLLKALCAYDSMESRNVRLEALEY